jgi:hypothetical protein
MEKYKIEELPGGEKACLVRSDDYPSISDVMSDDSLVKELDRNNVDVVLIVEGSGCWVYAKNDRKSKAKAKRLEKGD